MYQLFLQYIEQFQNETVNKSFFTAELKKMDKSEDSIHLMLDQLSFDAHKLSEYEKEKRKARTSLYVLIPLFAMLFFLPFVFAKYYEFPQRSVLFYTFVVAAPLYGISRALYTLRSIKKSKNRIEAKWMQF